MPNQLDNRVYAGFFVRLLAFVIDSMIAAIIVGIVKLPLAIAAGMGVDFLKSNFIFQFSFLDVLAYVGVAAYFVLLTYFAHATPGKLLLRLEVVSDDKWSFINILYRETIGRFLSSLLNIGYLAVIVTQKKQGFHDMLCNTYVVYRGVSPAQKVVAEQPVLSTSIEVSAEPAVPESVTEVEEESALRQTGVEEIPALHETEEADAEENIQES